MSGWTSAAGPSTRRRRFGRRLGILILVLPLAAGAMGAPANVPGAQGDELGDARARQALLRKDIEAQKVLVAHLATMQAGLSADIHQTSTQLHGLNADLAAVRVKITALQDRIQTVQDQYDALVTQLANLDGQLLQVEGQEAAKKADLGARRALLAERIRDAYDSDRTSLLESFLSGGTFTDVLAEMSYYIDVGEQDKALASQIAHDQETLAALHQTVVDTRDRTNELRQATAAQKRTLDASLADLKATKASLKALEQKTAAALAQQRSSFAKVARNKAAAAAALAKSAAAQKRLQDKIAEILRRRSFLSRIPSQYNGALAWPMGGSITQIFGCTGFSWEPRLGSCRHFHRGIDVVAPSGTPIRASANGTVIYIGWNYADGYDPAWIVVIAHSQALQTWYAHMTPSHPNGIRSGSFVRAGEIIGYEGNTGHSTGAHLHWAVMFNGNFANPRLFL